MASGTTTVGSVKYDASIDLESLKKSLAQADKIVKQSYDNQAKASKKAAKTSPASSGSSSGGGTTAYEAQVRVNAIKREAQETAKTISSYAPQVQRQFLTVERANNQVTNATQRSINAIQKYGENSKQAVSATNALNVAVQNQAQQQARYQAMLNGSNQSQSGFAQSMGDSITAIGGVVASLAILSGAYTVLQRGVVAANQFEASIAGVSRLSERFGFDAREATTAAKELAADGLITVATAAESLQKLLTAGVGLPQAIELVKGYKDQAAFGKSSTIDFDTAVKNLAESFYTENSAIGNLSGQTENWSQILEYGASVLGKNVSQLTEKERVQAKLIGQQRINNLVEGDSAVLAQTNAGAQARLNQTLLEIQTTIGRVTNMITGGFIGALGGMNEEGQKSVIAFGAGVTAFVGFLTVVPLAISAFRTIRTAIVSMGVASAFASGGITALLGGLAAIGAGVAVSSLIDNLDTTEELSDKFSQNVKEAEGGLGGAAQNAGDVAKQIASINEQMQQAREDYRYSLAKLVAEKNENIATLRQTLTDEERAYKNAFNERKASFDKTQNEELLTHQQKVRALQTQIDFLSKYNTAANNQQAEELKFALARENEEYKKSTQLRKTEFDTQTQTAKTEYEKRRAENQKKLEEELGLLKKHRKEVLSVRGVMLLDEIEMLKKQRDEQLKSLNKQVKDAATKGAEIGKALGTSRAKNEVKWYTKHVEGTPIVFSSKNKKDIDRGFSVQDYNGSRYVVPAFATGGYTGRGGKHDVAGIVHAGEYVLPKEQVNQVTGQPDLSKIGSSTPSNSFVFDFSSAIIPTDKAGMRNFAGQIARYINESTRAKTGKIAIEGV